IAQSSDNAAVNAGNRNYNGVMNGFERVIDGFERKLARNSEIMPMYRVKHDYQQRNHDDYQPGPVYEFRRDENRQYDCRRYRPNQISGKGFFPVDSLRNLITNELGSHALLDRQMNIWQSSVAFDLTLMYG